MYVLRNFECAKLRQFADTDKDFTGIIGKGVFFSPMSAKKADLGHKDRGTKETYLLGESLSS